MFRRRLRGLLSIAALSLWAVPLAAPASAAEGLTLTTAYPSITVSPGATASFDIEVKTTAPARVDLTLSGAPASWYAALHGGGNIVSAVYTDGKAATSVELSAAVPKDATGTTRMTVTATSGGSTATLPIEVKVEANASGTITVTPDNTALRGAANDKFNFTISVKNTKGEDQTFTANVTAPPDWTATATITGQAQAVIGTVHGNGGAASVAVAVTAAANTSAGEYPIDLVVTVAGEPFEIPLKVEITGNYKLTLTTPNDLLSMRGTSGTVTEQVFTITNTGTAPITNVTISASPPTNWKVEFDPTTTDVIQPQASVQVTAKVTPSGAAIAGDYSITFTARAKETVATDTADFRFTVESSIVGAIIGGALILAAVGGLLWVFQRYGRR